MPRRAVRRLVRAPRGPGPRGAVGGLRDGRAAGARLGRRRSTPPSWPPSSAVSVASGSRRGTSRAGARTSTTAPRTSKSASVIKIAVLTEAMAAVREGRVDLAERWELTAPNKADGSGMLLMLDPGLDPTWNDLATLMIGPSDNTATNAWIERLRVDAINARMQSLGFAHIRLFGTIPMLSQKEEDPSPWKGLRLGSMTPNEVAEWMTPGREGRAARRGFLEEDLRLPRHRPRAACGSPAAFRRRSCGPARPARCPECATTPGSSGRRRAASCSSSSPTGARPTAGAPITRASLAIAELARAIVEGWSRDLPEVAEKPQ